MYENDAPGMVMHPSKPGIREVETRKSRVHVQSVQDEILPTERKSNTVLDTKEKRKLKRKMITEIVP